MLKSTATNTSCKLRGSYLRLLSGLRTFIVFLVPLSLLGGPGDTSFVSAHQDVDMTWYEAYRSTAVFPNSYSAHQVWLRYELGCATGGCSDWDYTTVVALRVPTGATDSSVASIDTIGQNPLVVDTSWNYFPEREKVELAKVITPYGGNLANDWSRNYYFDVTDYASLLQDSVEVEVFYQGWSSGFSATLDFLIIEGTPPRKAKKVHNLYQGKYNYLNSQDFEQDAQPEKWVQLDSSAQHWTLRNAPSGHGFVNSLNCAEFCQKDYYVKVNGQQVADQAIWRDDCGANPTFPQAGTWLYDRANWCPGDRVMRYDHRLDTYIQADSVLVDVDLEAYSYTVPSGEVPANYNLSTQLIEYGAFEHQIDPALEWVEVPSTWDEFARANPQCSQARVRIRNKGGDTLRQVRIAYGINGNQHWQDYHWTGSLAPLESVAVDLPMDSSIYWDTYQSELQFTAQLHYEGAGRDEVAYNNAQSVKVELPPRFPQAMELRLRTNAAAAETFWRLEDQQGHILASGDQLSNNTLYRDTFQLSPGCYRFFVGDRDEDGLSFFANNDGSGSLVLRGLNGSNFYQSFSPDFGSRLEQHFTVGYGLALAEEQSGPLWQVYPNPARDQIFIESLGEAAGKEVHYRLINTQGAIVKKGALELPWGQAYRMGVSDLQPGLYHLEMNGPSGNWSSQLILR